MQKTFNKIQIVCDTNMDISCSTNMIEINKYHIDETDFLSNSYKLTNRDGFKVFRVFVDGRMLSTDEIDSLAENDGFDATRYFFSWFNSNFKGQIIHWTDFKY